MSFLELAVQANFKGNLLQPRHRHLITTSISRGRKKLSDFRCLLYFGWYIIFFSIADISFSTGFSISLVIQQCPLSDVPL